MREKSKQDLEDSKKPIHVKKKVLMTAVTLSPETLVLSAVNIFFLFLFCFVLKNEKVKRAHYDPNAFIVRFYNPTREEIEGSLWFSSPIAAAFRSRLDEKKLAQIDLKGSNNTISGIHVPRKKIITVLVYPK